jgi:hypothetical protein
VTEQPFSDGDPAAQVEAHQHAPDAHLEAESDDINTGRGGSNGQPSQVQQETGTVAGTRAAQEAGACTDAREQQRWHPSEIRAAPRVSGPESVQNGTDPSDDYATQVKQPAASTAMPVLRTGQGASHAAARLDAPDEAIDDNGACAPGAGSNAVPLQRASSTEACFVDEPLADSARDLQRRWAHACQTLHCLPSHGRCAQLPPYSPLHLQRLTATSAWPQALPCAAERSAVAPVVIQIGLHSPDAYFTKTQALLVRADSTLADVKDAIVCQNDRHAHDELGCDVLGGLFYIGGKLYSDTRHQGEPGYVDYTTNILAFLSAQAASITKDVSASLDQGGLQRFAAAVPSPVAVAHMQDVRLQDLVLCISQPRRGLFVHAGACEHAVVFEDVRLQHVDDPSVATGPAALPAGRCRLEKCCICAIKPAVKVAFEDLLAPESPAFFCDQCFEELHLDSAGRIHAEAGRMDVYEVYE